MGNSAGPKITKDGLVLDFDAANTKSYNFYADPYASNVSLHLKMDGANGSATFTDSSPNALAVTAVGNAQISTTQSKYNGSAGYFDGTGDYLSIASSSYFNLPADFTVECWFNASNGANSQQVIAGKWTGTGNVAWTVVINPGLSQILLGTANSGSFVATLTFTATSTITTNTWHHLAVVRSGSTVLVFLNGVQAGAGQTSTSNLTASDSNALTIGQFQGINYFTGYIDELKITKGVARYTSAFTSPPIPSTCTDLTKNKNVGTLTNGVDYNFSNGGSLVFDGVNDYVKAPFSSNYNFGSGDFTVSAWINMTVLPSNNWSSFVTHGVSGSAQRWVFYYDTRTSQSSPGLRFSSINASNAANIDISVGSTSGWSAGVWYYVTITRVGNVFTLYRNGIQAGNTVTDADAIIDVTSNGLYLGMENTGVDAPLNGKISLVQIYKGKGLTSGEVYNNFVANRGRFGV